MSKHPSLIAFHIASRIVRAYSPQLPEDATEAIARIIDREAARVSIDNPYADDYTHSVSDAELNAGQYATEYKQEQRMRGA